jgi:hypothetical protein
MNVNVDPALSRAAAPGAPERKAPEARQAKWLCELERALFESGLKNDAGKKQAQGAPAGLAPQALADAAPPVLIDSDVRASAAPACGAGPVRAGAAPAPQPQASDTSESARPLQQAMAAAPVSVAAEAHGVRAGIDRPASGSAPAAPAALAANGMPGFAPAPPSAASAATAPAALTVAAAVRLAPALEIAPLPQLQGTDAEPAADAARQDAAPDESHAAPARVALDAYARNALHLYRGDDGVQAWIRDASLQPLQAEAVRRALAQELGSAGEKLLAVTINGRKLGATTGTEQQQHDSSIIPILQGVR